jgi:hypothetical protein
MVSWSKELSARFTQIVSLYILIAEFRLANMSVLLVLELLRYEIYLGELFRWDLIFEYASAKRCLFPARALEIRYHTLG